MNDFYFSHKAYGRPNYGGRMNKKEAALAVVLAELYFACDRSRREERPLRIDRAAFFAGDYLKRYA